jgi:hypothetical protein
LHRRPPEQPNRSYRCVSISVRTSLMLPGCSPKCQRGRAPIAFARERRGGFWENDSTGKFHHNLPQKEVGSVVAGSFRMVRNKSTRESTSWEEAGFKPNQRSLQREVEDGAIRS